MRTVLAALIITSTLALAPAANAAQTPDEILSQLAGQQTHSWIDNPIPVAELVDRVKSGDRINVTCAVISEVARRLLREQGYPARVAGAVTLENPNGLTDGHALVEVFQQGRWQLYDIDANAQAVDEQGQGVSIVQQLQAVQEGRAFWREIANDPLYRVDEPDPILQQVSLDVFSDPAAFYRRVMGFALFPRDPAGSGGAGMWYVDASQAERVAQNWPRSYHLATAEQWAMLTTSVNAPPIPVVRKLVSTPVPAPPVVVARKPVVAAAAQNRPCQRLKRQYRRTHTRKARARYARCRARHST